MGNGFCQTVAQNIEKTGKLVISNARKAEETSQTNCDKTVMVLNGLEESLASTKSSIAKIASDITETRNSVSDKIIKNTNCLEVNLNTAVSTAVEDRKIKNTTFRA